MSQTDNENARGNSECLTDLPQPVKLAVYDFDGTTLSGFSPVALAKDVLGHGAMYFHDALYLAKWSIFSKLNLPQGMEQVRRALFRPFTHMNREEADVVLKRIFDDHIAPLIKPACLEQIEADRARGCVILYVSAAYEPFVRFAKDILHFDAAFACENKVDSRGHYTLEQANVPPEGPEKLEVVRRFANELFGEGNWILERAYADEIKDETLLSAALHPFVVDPNRFARKMACAHQWPILNWSR